MPTRPPLDGIDVSHHNVITSWDAIPPFDLWCMKATEGRSFVSPVFHDRWQRLRDLDVRWRGAYHWIRSDSKIVAQVDHLRRTLDRHGGLAVGEFVMLDWETTPDVADVTVAQVEEWIGLAEELWPGRIIVYSSDWVPGFRRWRDRHPTYPLWYANYSLSTGSTGGAAESAHYGAAVWQWTSTAPVPGFARPIDGNAILDSSTLDLITARTTLKEIAMIRPVVWKHPNKPEVFGVAPGGVVLLDDPIRDVWLADGAVDLRNATGSTHNDDRVWAAYMRASGAGR